jgi:murein DD-endopeptidase MepM/ murein hydrolase activator NlpD
LKRTFTQKVKQVPSCAADSFEALLKLYVGKQSVGTTIPTEMNRKARTSAAMIGLAISMGAAGILLPKQGDEAMAVEPVATEPNLPTLAMEPSTTVATKVVEPSVVAVSTPTVIKPETQISPSPVSSIVVEHQVREGETLWELSSSYQVQPEAIAASNNIQASAVLPVGQTLKIPAVNGIVHQVKAGETIDKLSESYGVAATQLQAYGATALPQKLKTGESVTVPGNVNDLLKARQNIALNNLKEQKNRLNDSLAELRSEESNNLSQQATGTNKVVLANPVSLQNQASPSEESAALAAQSPQLASSPTVPQLNATPSSSVRIAVPTPEIASTPVTATKINATPQSSSVRIAVPTPEIASTPFTAPKVAVTPNTKIEPATELKASGAPQAPQPVVIPTVSSQEVANLYQVKPGDTIEAIARRHGLSTSELIKLNGLNNPNLLSVNQRLKVPSASAGKTTKPIVATLPGVSSKPVSVGLIRQRSVATSPQDKPAVSDRDSVVVPTAPQSQQNKPNVLAQSTRTENTQASSRAVVETKTSSQSESNPYIDRLRSDILKLRQDFGQKQETTQATAPRNVIVPAKKTPTASSLNNASMPIRIDPQFNPKRANENLQAELQRRQQQQLNQGPINIEVPAPETAALPPRGLVAAAPTSAGSYNPSLRTPVGQEVSPEVPGLFPPGNQNQSGNYIWPAKGVLTSGYGMRWGRMHKGIDIAAPVGTPVVASAPGVIVTAGWNSGGYGNLVEIQHPDGSLTLYAHNNRILVRRGQEVTQGQQIAEMGSTGHSTGPHTHFEMHPTGRGAVNPIAFLPRK